MKDGRPESEAIQIAIGVVKRWAAGGGKVDAGTRAAAALALGQWEKLKAANAAKGAVKRVAEAVAEALDTAVPLAVVIGEALRFEADPERLRGIEAVMESWSRPTKGTTMNADEWARVLEADAKGAGSGDEGSENAGMSKVFCVKDRKKVMPTAKGMCPDCGMNLKPMMSKGDKSKISEATALAVLEAMAS